MASECCPRQNEHIDIKRVAYNHVTAILQRCQKGQKCVVVVLLLPLRNTFYFQAISAVCSWLSPFCKQNLVFIQPRWQLRRTHFFNHCIMFCFNEFAFTVQVKHKLNSTQILGFILMYVFFCATCHFHTRVLAKNVTYFPFNSWLSFQRLCRLLRGSVRPQPFTPMSDAPRACLSCRR